MSKTNNTNSTKGSNGSPLKTKIPMDEEKFRAAISSTMDALQKSSKEKAYLAPFAQLFGFMVEQHLMVLQMVKTQQEIISTLQSQTGTIEITAEEKERRRSVVVSGLPESDAHSARGKFIDDTNTVSQLLDAIDVECDAVQTYRLGKPIAGRARLVKIVFPTSYFQSDCLKKAKNLKSSNNFKRVFIRPSMTREQREADYLLRQRLRAANEEGKKTGQHYHIYRGDIVLNTPKN